MKKKALSLALSLLMSLSLLPASVLTAAAADAYQVLFEPQLDGPVGMETKFSGSGIDLIAYGDTVAVYSVTEKVYQETTWRASRVNSTESIIIRPSARITSWSALPTMKWVWSTRRARLW